MHTFRGTNLTIKNAKLWLGSRKIFRECREGFQRINVACPKKTLQEALVRLKKAVDSLQNDKE